MHESGLAAQLIAAANQAVPSTSWHLTGLTVEVSDRSHLDDRTLQLHLAAASGAVLDPASITVVRTDLPDPDSARLVSVSVGPS